MSTEFKYQAFCKNEECGWEGETRNKDNIESALSDSVTHARKGLEHITNIKKVIE